MCVSSALCGDIQLSQFGFLPPICFWEGRGVRRNAFRRPAGAWARSVHAVPPTVRPGASRGTDGCRRTALGRLDDEPFICSFRHGKQRNLKLMGPKNLYLSLEQGGWARGGASFVMCTVSGIRQGSWGGGMGLKTAPRAPGPEIQRRT